MNNCVSCPVCGVGRIKPREKWWRGLSVRAANALTRNGFISHSDVKRYIDAGYQLARLPEIGLNLEKEIIEWTKIQTTTEQPNR